MISCLEWCGRRRVRCSSLSLVARRRCSEGEERARRSLGRVIVASEHTREQSPSSPSFHTSSMARRRWGAHRSFIEMSLKQRIVVQGGLTTAEGKQRSRNLAAPGYTMHSVTKLKALLRSWEPTHI